MMFEKLLNSDFSWKRLVSSVILIALIVYIAFGAIAYFWLADKLIFQPQPVFQPENDSILKLKTPNQEKISARLYKNPNSEYTILFSHGNAEDIFSSDDFFQQLSDAGFNVLAYDYRGYGTSEGKSSEENSYQDAETAYDYLINEVKIPPKKIIIHGRSLGGAISIDLASKKICGGLIVESTFVSAFRVLTHYPIYPFDKFRSIKKIKNVKCPVLFIHGKHDEIIPFWHSEMLFAEANEPKLLYSLENANHNNVFLVGGKSYLQKIKDFAGNLPK